jgi:isopentenyl diphosphate isomerase/L-lactate dehydrogenase-like FMN-dependent dehydrogenase
MSETRNEGDSSRITREYLDSLLIELRHLDAVEPSTKLELYGETFRTPIMLAALSHMDKVHPQGMAECARGVLAAGAVMWFGMGEDAELERITATGARTIKIIKPHADNREVLRRIEHAEKCGCLAVGMDVDHAFGSRNDRGGVLGLPVAPKTQDEIKSFVRATKLPFIVKGVLSETDAKKCLDAGVRGIVVSHHHGIADYALPPLRILPKIAGIIKNQFPIFVDCSINRGMDAFKSLALGAAAVSTGRAVMGALGSDGAAGVQKVIEEMTAELNWAMAVTCSPDLTHIDSTLVWPPERIA